VRGELWIADLYSGQRSRLFPNFLMQHYAMSTDGQRVAFVAADDTGRYPVFVTTLNGRSSLRQVTTKGASSAYFAAGYVFFVSADTGPKFIYRVREDGSELQQ